MWNILHIISSFFPAQSSWRLHDALPLLTTQFWAYSLAEYFSPTSERCVFVHSVVSAYPSTHTHEQSCVQPRALPVFTTPHFFSTTCSLPSRHGQKNAEGQTLDGVATAAAVVVAEESLIWIKFKLFSLNPVEHCICTIGHYTWESK